MRKRVIVAALAAMMAVTGLADAAEAELERKKLRKI